MISVQLHKSLALINFLAIKRLMKLRSWHLALIGLVLQFAVAFAMFLGGLSGKGWGAVFLVIAGAVFMAGSLLALPSVLLLLFERTRRVGAIVSLVLGAVGIALQVGAIVGVFLIAAGVLYFWKRI